MSVSGVQLFLCPPFLTSSRMYNNTILCHLNQLSALSCWQECWIIPAVSWGPAPPWSWGVPLLSLFSGVGWNWHTVTTHKPALDFWHLGLVSTTKIALSPTTEFCYVPVITSSGPCPGGSLNIFGNTLTRWSSSKTWRKFPFIFEGKTNYKYFPYISWLVCSQHLFLHQQWVGGLHLMTWQNQQ